MSVEPTSNIFYSRYQDARCTVAPQKENSASLQTTVNTTTSCLFLANFGKFLFISTEQCDEEQLMIRVFGLRQR